MNDKDKAENEKNFIPPAEQEKDPSSSIEQEEEIIFPRKETDPSQAPPRKFRVKFSPLKISGLVVLVVGV